MIKAINNTNTIKPITTPTIIASWLMLPLSPPFVATATTAVTLYTVMHCYNFNSYRENTVPVKNVTVFSYKQHQHRIKTLLYEMLLHEMYSCSVLKFQRSKVEAMNSTYRIHDCTSSYDRLTPNYNKNIITLIQHSDACCTYRQ